MRYNPQKSIDIFGFGTKSRLGHGGDGSSNNSTKTPHVSFTSVHLYLCFLYGLPFILCRQISLFG